MKDLTATDTRKDAWEEAYTRGQNFVFYPQEELIRFLARHVRKRVGLDKFIDIMPNAGGAKWLDVGCGIGRHVVLGHEMGFEAYGVDLSTNAVALARQWLERTGITAPERRIQQADVRALPWQDGYFSVAVSHGVFDSMPFDIARAGILELHRAMSPGGLFYCDLIAGQPVEEIVTTAHEENTVQSYFDNSKIDRLFDSAFEVIERIRITREAAETDATSSRWHLILRKA